MYYYRIESDICRRCDGGNIEVKRAPTTTL